MRKVITINLNNNAYPIDEDGYEALRSYLDTAERNLSGNPDRAEILIDLEQAIGDKCRACLGPHKTVVSTSEIERILAEMGPVEAGTAAPADAPGNAAGTTARPEPRRLYRLKDGAMWAGVCNGLAAYFGMDVVWMRLIFILATLFTSGFWLLVYIAMIFIVPIAETAQQQAAARGEAFNARELVDRLKKKPEGFRGRHERVTAAGFTSATSNAMPAGSPGAAARVAGGIVLPVLTTMSALWFATMAVAVFIAWQTSLVPDVLPRWIAVIALLAVYALFALPIGAGRRASLYYANGGRAHGWADAWSGILWIAVVAVIAWVAWSFLPSLQELLRDALAQRSTMFVQAGYTYRTAMIS